MVAGTDLSLVNPDRRWHHDRRVQNMGAHVKDNAVENGDISLRRAIRDWRDWWEIQTDLFLTMATKALFLDLSDIHENHTVLRKYVFGSDHEARIQTTLADWNDYVSSSLPLAARSELSFLLRHEHVPETVIKEVHAQDFLWTDGPAFTKLQEEALSGGSKLRENMRAAILSAEETGGEEGKSLQIAMLDYLNKLEAIAMQKE